jgi:hypothetical protein
MNAGVGFVCLAVAIGSGFAILFGAGDKKLRVVACGFYAPAVLLFALAVEYQSSGDGHPGLWVGAVGCLLVALGVHARAMGRDL